MSSLYASEFDLYIVHFWGITIKTTEKALAIPLPPWYSVCREVLPTNGCLPKLIRLLRRALEGLLDGVIFCYE